MSNQHIDLTNQILREVGGDRAQIVDILAWLDDHRDQAPEPTITESRMWEISQLRANVHGWDDRKMIEAAGVRIVPDPKAAQLPSTPGATVTMRKNHQWVRTVTGTWISTDGSILDQDDAQEIADEHGFEIVHDGEENAEHDRDWWIENASVNDAEDCEACVGDLCPVHHGIALGIDFVTKKIAALGDDPELFNSIPNPPNANEGAQK